MSQWITRIKELVRRCEELSLALFGFVMLLLAMWEILKRKLGL
jgi:hypothetical protein